MSKFIRHVYLYIIAMVDMCNWVTCLHQTPIIEWCVVWRGSQNRHQKDVMCLKKIARLRAPNMLTTLDSTVNVIGGPICPSNGTRKSSL